MKTYIMIIFTLLLTSCIGEGGFLSEFLGEAPENEGKQGAVGYGWFELIVGAALLVADRSIVYKPFALIAKGLFSGFKKKWPQSK